MHVLSRITAFIVSLIAWPVAAFFGLIDRFVFPLLDHRTHADLDLIGRPSALISMQASRARSFTERCLTHSLFDGNGFHAAPIPS
jgi:hypothetical protein